MFQFDEKNIDNSDVILWWLIFDDASLAGETDADDVTDEDEE